MPEKSMMRVPKKRGPSQANDSRSKVPARVPDWTPSPSTELGDGSERQQKWKARFDGKSDLSLVALHFLELRRRSRLRQGINIQAGQA
jgi:hypothetical protein